MGLGAQGCVWGVCVGGHRGGGRGWVWGERLRMHGGWGGGGWRHRHGGPRVGGGGAHAGGGAGRGGQPATRVAASVGRGAHGGEGGLPAATALVCVPCVAAPHSSAHSVPTQMLRHYSTASHECQPWVPTLRGARAGQEAEEEGESEGEEHEDMFELEGLQVGVGCCGGGGCGGTTAPLLHPTPHYCPSPPSPDPSAPAGRLECVVVIVVWCWAAT